jgi:hypothetical protein
MGVAASNVQVEVLGFALSNLQKRKRADS